MVRDDRFFHSAPATWTLKLGTGRMFLIFSGAPRTETVAIHTAENSLLTLLTMVTNCDYSMNIEAARTVSTNKA